MKYIAAFVLTVLYSPMLLLWALFDVASGKDATKSLLSDWWL